MSRRTKWILLVLLVVLVGGVAALVLTQQPKLDDARTQVDTAWKPLRATDQLPLRYQTLTGALSAFDAAGGADRDVSKDLHAALRRWDAALQHGDAGAQATAANEVEAQGTRLIANALGSPRLASDKAVTDSLVQVRADQAEPELVAAYNHAVRDYEDVRTGALAQPVAKVLGFDARPVLAIDVDRAGTLSEQVGLTGPGATSLSPRGPDRVGSASRGG